MDNLREFRIEVQTYLRKGSVKQTDFAGYCGYDHRYFSGLLHGKEQLSHQHVKVIVSTLLEQRLITKQQAGHLLSIMDYLANPAVIDPGKQNQIDWGNSPASVNLQNTEKRKELKKLLSDHSHFMRTRLESFVGREQELEEIEQKISDKLPTGGYVTITGQAGQGKSSIIAKLIDNRLKEQDQKIDNCQITYHFIPGVR